VLSDSSQTYHLYISYILETYSHSLGKLPAFTPTKRAANPKRGQASTRMGGDHVRLAACSVPVPVRVLHPLEDPLPRFTYLCIVLTIADSKRIAKMSTVADLCPVYAPFFGAMGCTAAIVFTCIGAA
jgi:hypothetical protein